MTPQELKQKKEEQKQKQIEDKKIQKELQKYYNNFKLRFKKMTKSELVAILWQQGMEYKKLQDIAQELFEENRQLKGQQDDTTVNL